MSGGEARPAKPRVVPFGDAALLVELGEGIDAQLNARVHALCGALRERAAGGPLAAIGQPVPAYASVLVPFDPIATSLDEVAPAVAELAAEVSRDEDADDALPDDVPLEIAVRYGGDDGPDLVDVAQRVRLSAAQVVELHASVVYRAYMLGFAPGFAYLGELPAELELPRRDTPLKRVPAGSVAIAGRQTAVYPLATPGGWHLIGRTEAVLWDPARAEPALITAGRLVRFVPR